MNGTLLAKLPNPFLMENGKTVSSGSDWKVRREEIKKPALELCYGGMPPEPDSTRGVLLYSSGRPGLSTYLVVSKSGGRELSFELRLYTPAMEKDKQYPVVLEGDGCWSYLSEKVIENFNSRGIIAAQFNRCALVRDVNDPAEVLDSPLYRFFPGLTSGTVAGWAWGFSRCIDVLEKLPFVDSANIAITGHSRGGKAVLAAGAADERPAIVNPNCSGAGGCGCWRYRVGDTNLESRKRNEVLDDLFRAFPNWMGREMKSYAGREVELPFDQHYLESLVAPRLFLQTDASADMWANPEGSYGTFLAAKEVYRFLKAEDRIFFNLRDGGHDHALSDFELLADLIDCNKNGKALPKDLRKDYFPEMRRIFDWTSP